MHLGYNEGRLAVFCCVSGAGVVSRSDQKGA